MNIISITEIDILLKSIKTLEKNLKCLNKSFEQFYEDAWKINHNHNLAASILNKTAYSGTVDKKIFEIIKNMDQDELSNYIDSCAKSLYMINLTQQKIKKNINSINDEINKIRGQLKIANNRIKSTEINQKNATSKNEQIMRDNVKLCCEAANLRDEAKKSDAKKLHKIEQESLKKKLSTENKIKREKLADAERLRKLELNINNN